MPIFTNIIITFSFYKPETNFKNPKLRKSKIDEKKLKYIRDFELLHFGKKRQIVGIINRFIGKVINKTMKPKPNGPPSFLIILIEIGKK